MSFNFKFHLNFELSLHKELAKKLRADNFCKT